MRENIKDWSHHDDGGGSGGGSGSRECYHHLENHLDVQIDKHICFDFVMFDWMGMELLLGHHYSSITTFKRWMSIIAHLLFLVCFVYMLICHERHPHSKHDVHYFINGSPLEGTKTNIHSSKSRDTTFSCLPEDDSSSRCTSMSPRLILLENNWLASSVNNALASIILQEKLGVCVDIVPSGIEAGLQLMEREGETNPIVLLEYWKLSNFENYKKYVLNGKQITDIGDLGPSGQIGWFVPNFMKDTVQNNYRHFRLTNATRMVSGSKTWVNYDEQIIKNLLLNLKLEYAPENKTEEYLIENIQKAQQERKEMVSYFWFPHQLFSRPDPPSRIYLPQYTVGCTTTHNIANGLVDCDYPLSSFSKLQTAAVRSLSSRVQNFLSSLRYKARDQVTMMGYVSYDSMSLENAACKWLSNNTATWKSWIAEPVIPIEQRTEFIISISVASFTVAIILVGIGVFLVGLLIRKNSIRKRENRLAPKAAPICIVFTHIQNASLLWTLDSDLMKKVIVIHHKIVRENIRKFRGYEVKTQSDGFMIAFHDPIEAVGCCFAIQNDLLKGNWSEDMLEFPDMKEVKWNNEIIYRGPRVKMGMHFGEEIEAQFDPTTKRYDYFGTTVNQAARTESKSQGGRVYVSAQVHSFIKHRTVALSSTNSLPREIPFLIQKDSVEEFREQVSDGQVHFENMGEFGLKGLKGVQTLYWAINSSSPRRFYIQQFEMGTQFRDSTSILTLPIYIETSDKERVELRQELTKCLTSPFQTSNKEKSFLLQRLILWTNNQDKTWLDFPIADLIDFVIDKIREGVSSVSTAHNMDDISIDMSSK